MLGVNRLCSLRAPRITARRGATVASVLALASAALWAKRTGVDAHAITAWVQSWGAWSVPAFVVAFCAGQIVQLPGTLFLVVARVVFGETLGLPVGYAGAVIAVTTPFVLARKLRGRNARAWEPRWKFLRRALARVDAQPIRSVALLRLFLWSSPPLGYALAFTRIRTRDYVIGSAIGLFPWVVLVFAFGRW